MGLLLYELLLAPVMQVSAPPAMWILSQLPWPELSTEERRIHMTFDSLTVDLAGPQDFHMSAALQVGMHVGLFNNYPHFVRFLQKRSQTGKASESWLFQTHTSYDSARFSSLATFLEKTNEVGVVIKHACVLG